MTRGRSGGALRTCWKGRGSLLLLREYIKQLLNYEKNMNLIIYSDFFLDFEETELLHLSLLQVCM